jgi:hypothetical protein
MASKVRIRTLLYLFFMFFLWFAIPKGFAQNPQRPEINLKAFIDEIFAVQDDDINYEDLYEALYQLYQDPLNINKANRADLENLYLLSPTQVTDFLSYREKYGFFLSLYELQSIPSFTEPIIRRLLPFITVEDAGLQGDTRPLLQRILTEKNNYLLLRASQVLEREKGFQPLAASDTNSQGQPATRYLGGRQRIFSRFRIAHSKDFSVGFTLEKDEGEQIVWNPSKKQYGMDFLSYHFYLENQKRFKKIAIGDYQIQIGQSLLLTAGFNVGKGAEPIQTVRRANLGIKPFTSLLEGGFFRGFSFTYNVAKNKLGEFDVTPFYSNTRRDANLTDDNGVLDSLNAAPEIFISAIQNTGYHRTATELSAKGTIREQNAGANFNFENKNKTLQIGSTFIYTHFSTPLKKTPALYNTFEFSGQENYNVGLNYSYNFQNLSFFGEAAMSKGGGKAVTTGMLASLSSKVSVSVLYRNFDKDFHSFYGSAFRENSRTINEQGFYMGLKIQPSRKFIFAAYYDTFRFPWLRYQVDAPVSTGTEYLIRLTYNPTKKITIYGQFREENKQQNLANNITPLDILTTRRKHNYLFNIDYKAEKIISLKSRIQYSDVLLGQDLTKGFVLIQDVEFDFGKWKLKTRWATFDIDDFNNRQYSYEDDVLYSFSLPAYLDQGTRNYILLEYDFSRKITLWVRYARTRLTNQKTFGSGLDAIPSPERNEMKMQLRIRF